MRTPVLLITHLALASAAPIGLGDSARPSQHSAQRSSPSAPCHTPSEPMAAYTPHGGDAGSLSALHEERVDAASAFSLPAYLQSIWYAWTDPASGPSPPRTRPPQRRDEALKMEQQFWGDEITARVTGASIRPRRIIGLQGDIPQRQARRAYESSTLARTFTEERRRTRNMEDWVARWYD